MHLTVSRLVFGLALLITTSLPAAAQGERVAEEYQYGVGLGGTNVASGIMGMYDLTPQITAQVSLGAFGVYTSVGANLWYRINQNDKYDIFAYGGAGVFNRSVFGTTFGVGGGGGVEWDWGEILNLDDFPPVFGSISLGVFFYGDDLGGIGFLNGGGSVHYRF